MSQEIITSEPATEVQFDTEIVFTDIIQTNGQLETKAFRYKITVDGQMKIFTVLCPSATIAREGLKNHFPTASIVYDGVSDHIIQIQG